VSPLWLYFITQINTVEKPETILQLDWLKSWSTECQSKRTITPDVVRCSALCQCVVAKYIRLFLGLWKKIAELLLHVVCYHWRIQGGPGAMPPRHVGKWQNALKVAIFRLKIEKIFWGGAIYGLANEPCIINGGTDPTRGRGNFQGLWGPFRNTDDLRCSLCCNRDYSIANHVMQQKGSFSMPKKHKQYSENFWAQAMRLWPTESEGAGGIAQLEQTIYDCLVFFWNQIKYWL